MYSLFSKSTTEALNPLYCTFTISSPFFWNVPTFCVNILPTRAQVRINSHATYDSHTWKKCFHLWSLHPFYKNDQLIHCQQLQLLNAETGLRNRWMKVSSMLRPLFLFSLWDSCQWTVTHPLTGDSTACGLSSLLAGWIVSISLSHLLPVQRSTG